jgi:hypothetical protein
MAQLPAKQLGTRDVTSVSRNAKITLQYGTSQFKGKNQLERGFIGPQVFIFLQLNEIKCS